MTKAKKISVILCILALGIGGLYFYWERQIPLANLIPEEEWVSLELRQGDGAGSGADIAFQEPPMEEILSKIESTYVTRAKKDRLLGGKYFQILLKKGGSYPTMLYIEGNGDIHVAVELDFDHWKNYEGGEELYEALSALARDLPA